MLVAAYDSQLKWAMSLADEFTAQGWTYSVVVPADIRSSLSADQVAAVGEVTILHLPWDALLARARDSDAVVLAVQGALVSRFTDELELLRAASPRRHEPVVVAGWVGIIIEKLVAGYLDRAGADVIIVNSADNLRAFIEAGRQLGICGDNLLLSGLPLLPARPAPLGSGPVRTLLFADQPTVPEAPWDRAYLYARLIDYARQHPDRSVLLKPRHRPGEGTFHVMQDHPETVLGRLGHLPANLSVTYDSITGLLERTDLLLTVSSTAGLEAIGRGVRTVFVSDLGVHEKHGNQVLVGSGLLATFDDVIADRLPLPEPAWLEDMFCGREGQRPVTAIVDRVTELTAVPPALRPGRAAADGPYLRARVAIRELRRALPRVAQDPTGSAPASARGVVAALMPLARRGDLFLRAVLPTSWHRAARRLWQRTAVG
jgi:hypothetical protein